MKHLLGIKLPVILFGAQVYEDVVHSILERNDI